MRKVLEVRCCCLPEKLRGYLEVDTSRRFHSFQLVCPDHVSATGIEDGIPLPIEVETIVLEVALVKVPGRGKYRALKAEEVPMEKLLLIKGFKPA